MRCLKPLKTAMLAIVIAGAAACGPAGRSPLGALQPKELHPATGETQRGQSVTPTTQPQTPTGTTSADNITKTGNSSSGRTDQTPGNIPRSQPSTPLPAGASIDFGDFFGEDQPETKQDVRAATLAPKDYEFQSPISNAKISDFYGPRVLGTGVLAAALENGSVHAPVTVKNTQSAFWQFHSGVDFAAKDGTPVRSIGRGTVFLSNFYTQCGWIVVVKHEPPSGTLYSVYFHLSSPTKGKTAKIGTRVNTGDVIALSGHSGQPLVISHGKKIGCVEGPHLHLEMRIKDGNVKVPASAQGRHDYIFAPDTAKVNPADYIASVDDACQKRKRIEADNAKIVQAQHLEGLPPLTAGRCSQKFERRLTDMPEIYFDSTNLARR